MERDIPSTISSRISNRGPVRGTLRSALANAMAQALTRQELSQVSAARICETDQPSISKILAGRHQNVSAEKLFSWLNALGWDVEITLKRNPNAGSGALSVKLDE